MGIALFSFHSEKVQALIHMADVAMYTAKKLEQAYCLYQTEIESSENRA